ncbi:MAG: hypothetical protein E6H04_12930 [Bacillati bacterium ANGP1]|uniref:DUF5666 domain-containing protein n=1 Tax=Candidatus Segetimicrobium genomatis TaxID=2569760 RepID=A0A537J3R4_9BACT|nr:MAG: hypothetical protein E6H04_12930 [Terrabacteria group bacterium ANGP1]
MRYTVVQRWILAGLCALSVGLLGWTPPARAQIDPGAIIGTVTGVTTTLTGTTTTLEGTGLLAAGTSDALQASAIADQIPSVLTGEALHATTIGYPDQIDSEASLADLALSVGVNTIGADLVIAQASAAQGAAGTGIAEIDNLSINGVPILVTGDPNQTISIPGGTVVLYEQQILSDGTIVVNALHATIAGVTDVMVGSAMAGPSGGQASAVQASY